MAGSRSSQGQSRGAAPRGRSVEPLPVWMKLFLIVTLAPLIAVLFPTFMLVGLGLLPTLAVFLFDKRRNKSFAMTVGLTNICGVLPSLADLWEHGQTMQAANAIAGDPLFWLLPLCAAGVGWLIFMGTPPIIAAYYETATEARIRTLMLKQQSLIETWGEEVRGDDPEAEAETEGPAVTAGND